MNTPATEYDVVSIRGRSQAGGNPDTVANKILANWFLRIAPGVSSLHEGAVPSDTPNMRHRLKTWEEGLVVKGQLLLKQGNSETGLDRGRITSTIPPTNGSDEVTVTLEGNYLLEMIILCKPLGKPLFKPLATEEKGKQKTWSGKEIIELVDRKACVAFGLAVKSIKDAKRRFAPDVRVKNAVLYLLKEEFCISPTMVRNTLFPHVANAGFMYSCVEDARILMETDVEYAGLIRKVVQEIKEEMEKPPTETVPVPPNREVILLPKATSETSIVAKLMESNPPSAEEMCIYTLAQSGLSAAAVGAGFGIPIERVHQAVGHVVIHLGEASDKLAPAIRRAARH